MTTFTGTLTADDVAAMDNATLDQAYATAYYADNVIDVDTCAQEILTRQGGVLGFFEGVAGDQRFPLYTQLSASGQNPHVSATFDSVNTARTAVADQAVKVGAFSLGVSLPILAVGAMILLGGR